MRGSIHGIWIVKKSGKLHPQVVPNLSSLANTAAKSNFQVILWTNVEELSKEDIALLNTTNIKIGNPHTFKQSPLYKYYQFFYQKGLNGDTAALALASDIFRMVILDFSPEDKFFIYMDPNDINLSNLSDNLKHIDHRFTYNKLGYAFPLGPTSKEETEFDLRNDVLIALKKTNPQFFKDYLNAYWANLERTYKRYTKPKDIVEAKFYANLISNSTSILFFRLEKYSDNSLAIAAQFGLYKEEAKYVNSFSFLNLNRTLENANTWLPTKDQNFDAKNEVAAVDMLINSILEDQKNVAKRAESKNNLIWLKEHGHFTQVAIGSIALISVIMALMIGYAFFKRRFAKSTANT
jgi:hypothetical protein